MGSRQESPSMHCFTNPRHVNHLGTLPVDDCDHRETSCWAALARDLCNSQQPLSKRERCVGRSCKAAINTEQHDLYLVRVSTVAFSHTFLLLLTFLRQCQLQDAVTVWECLVNFTQEKGCNRCSNMPFLSLCLCTHAGVLLPWEQLTWW
jgi:hypothetical protein